MDYLMIEILILIPPMFLLLVGIISIIMKIKDII